MKKGFTLIELLVFVGIFSIVTVAFVTMLIAVSNIQTQQVSQSTVTRESQFLLQQIQYNVEQASVIDMTQDTATTTLRLRMGSSAIDPTTISLVGGVVYIQQGSGPQVPLSSNKVTVSNLSFTRHANPPGNDSVSVAFNVSYNTNNVEQAFAEMFQTSVTRVSAATFDSNLIPSSTNTYTLGAGGQQWSSINGLINFNSAGTGVGIGATPVGAKLQVDGNIYVDTSTAGVVLRDSSGVCWRVTISTGGALQTASITCP